MTNIRYDQANIRIPQRVKFESFEPKEELSRKKLQNETPARMTMLSTGGGLLLLFLLCSKVNKLTTVDFVARLFEPVVVMRLVAILSENKCCQAEETSCPAGCFCATKRGEHLPPDLVCQKKKKNLCLW